MGVSLSDLESADWNDITGLFYGSPDEVLNALRALAAGMDDEQAVFENIYHQGDVYETTARAVPFLVEMVQPNAPTDQEARERILIGLAFLHCGGHPHDPSVTERVRGGIADGLAVYLPLIADTRPGIRFAALLLLGHLYGRASEIAPTVRARFEAAGRAVRPAERAALLFCLGRLTPAAKRLPLFLPHFRNADEPKIIRLAAALLLAEGVGSSLPDVLSGAAMHEEVIIPKEVVGYLSATLKAYGTTAYESLERQFDTLTAEAEGLDVALEYVLGELEDGEDK